MFSKFFTILQSTMQVSALDEIIKVLVSCLTSSFYSRKSIDLRYLCRSCCLCIRDSDIIQCLNWQYMSVCMKMNAIGGSAILIAADVMLGWTLLTAMSPLTTSPLPVVGDKKTSSHTDIMVWIINSASLLTRQNKIQKNSKQYSSHYLYLVLFRFSNVTSTFLWWKLYCSRITNVSKRCLQNRRLRMNVNTLSETQEWVQETQSSSGVESDERCKGQQERILQVYQQQKED